jgi:hypothetical protein
VTTVEPDGGNLLVRIWEGPGWATGRGYSTNGTGYRTRTEMRDVKDPFGNMVM